MNMLEDISLKLAEMNDRRKKCQSCYGTGWKGRMWTTDFCDDSLYPPSFEECHCDVIYLPNYKIYSRYKAVKSLIPISKGGKHTRRGFYRKHWYSLCRTEFKPGGWEYKLEEQLEAIKILGKTISTDALRHLEKMAQYEVNCDDTCCTTQWTNGTTVYKPDEAYYFTAFPNVSGELKDKLYTSWGESLDPTRPTPPFKDNAKILLSKNPYYQLLLSAINELKSSIKGPPVA